MSDIEAILFDLDDTLVQYERSPGEVLQRSFELVGCGPLFSVEEYYSRYDEFAEQYDSMDALRSACFAALAEANGNDRQLGRDVAETFSEERDQTRVELLPEVGHVLPELSRAYRLAIVTNGAADAQRQKIDAVNLHQWVDTVVVAGHETPPKPDTAPFEQAIDSIDATPATAVHVGDSLETDIVGAASAGLDSVWISASDSTGEHTPTHRIESVGELLSLPWVTGSSSRTR